jgi:hypothetical protein
MTLILNIETIALQLKMVIGTHAMRENILFMKDEFLSENAFSARLRQKMGLL